MLSPETVALSYAGLGLGMGGWSWSWVDASRDDIQVSAAASNGGGDSQRGGSIGEARRGETRRGAGLLMQAWQDASTVRHNDTKRHNTVQYIIRAVQETTQARKTAAASRRSRRTVRKQCYGRNSSHKVGQ